MKIWKRKCDCLFLDTLVSHSGKVLVPDLIGQLTTELLERVKDVVSCEYDAR